MNDTHDDELTAEAVTPSTNGHQPARMRAVVQHRYGGADTLQVATAPRPTIGPDQVLIEVVAAGIDRGVWHLMTGQPYLMRVMGFGLRAPKQRIPGLDVAGRVSAVGDRVTRFRPGDEVFGIASGTFAEFAVADEVKLSRKPTGVSFEQAAVATISGITALQALTDVGGVQAGQRVLIIGASGGVGTYAVQLAVAYGATVTGVASTAKLDLVRSLGAHHVIDYTQQSLDAEGGAYDLVVVIGGLTPTRRLRELLTDRGTLVFVGAEGGGRITGGIGRQVRAAMLSPFVRHDLKMFISTEHHAFIERLAVHLADGSVVPAIDRTVELDDVPAALRALESGAVRGKIAVRIGGGA